VSTAVAVQQNATLSDARRRVHHAFEWLAGSRLLSVILLLILWEIGCRVTGINPTVIPRPSSILGSAVDIALHYQLPNAIVVTLQALVPGFLLAALLGIPLGVAMGVYRYVRWLWDPYVSILLGTPLLAMIPVLVIWFGLGLTTRTVAAFIFAFPLIVLNAQAGVRSVGLSLVEMSTSFEVSRRHLFQKVLLPGSLPSIVLGLRLGISHAVKGVIIAEMLMGAPGLGGLIITFGEAYRTDHLLAVVFVTLVIVLIVDAGFSALHGRLAPWDQRYLHAGAPAPR
jgi:ABC-type nitrate/sulfonate/bicarbonate transport system permease component